jgi:hypothetical protein
LFTQVAITQTNLDPVEVLPKSDTTVVPPTKPQTASLTDLPIKITSDPNANPVQYHYPIQKDPTTTAYKESSEAVATPPIVDLQKQDVFGVQPPPVVFDRPENIHPSASLIHSF